jgi:hypothetical protein
VTFQEVLICIYPPPSFQKDATSYYTSFGEIDLPNLNFQIPSLEEWPFQSKAGNVHIEVPRHDRLKATRPKRPNADAGRRTWDEPYEDGRPVLHPSQPPIPQHPLSLRVPFVPPLAPPAFVKAECNRLVDICCKMQLSHCRSHSCPQCLERPAAD